jgi:lipopolysaccharide transport system permease protein
LALRARRATPASRAAERVVQALAKALVYPFRALWRNRALIASMVRRDIQGRYRGSVAGLFWTVLHPLLLMATYFFVFAVVLKVRFGSGAEAAGPVNFLLYFIAGMLPWLAFSEALGRSANVVLEHRTLVTRVVFPVEILPVNLAAAGLVSEFFGLLVFVAAIAGVGKGTPPATALYLPLVLIPQILLTIGLCWFLAALGVFLRDTGQFLSFLLTLWFFATPICYPETLVPPALQGVFGLNPVYVLARAYRAIFLEAAAPSWSALGGLSAAALALFLFGFAWFHKAKKVFADVI